MKDAEKGLYVAQVTDEGVKTIHANETAVADAQIGKLFRKKNDSRAYEKQNATEDQQKANRLKAAQKRRRCCMIKDVAGLISGAVLVYLTYAYGLYIAIAAITGCIVAATCRIIGYVEKGREAYGKA